MHPDVVVVGGGTAGLTAAAVLSREGKRVHVYEPNSWLGGFSGTFEVDGFTLNLGAHVLEDPGSGITAIFDHLGLPLGHAAVSSEMPVWNRAENRWGSIRDHYSASKPQLKKVIRAIVDSPWEAFDEWDDRPLRAWLAQHTDDTGVYELFEYLAFLEFLTTRWWEHSASDSLYLRKMHFGERGTAGYSFWPDGGWKAMFDGLAGVIRNGGGVVATGMRATVLVDHNVARGVAVSAISTEVPNELTPAEIIEADQVIVALPAWDIASVIPAGVLPDWYSGQIDLLSDLRHRDAWVNLAIATHDAVPIHDRLELATWAQGPVSGRPGFVFEQTAYDATTAPYGVHLYVAGLAVNGSAATDRAAMIEVAEQLERDLHVLMPGLRHPVWSRRQLVFDPSIGVAAKPMLVGSYRPHWQAPNIDGLWLAHETLRSRGVEDDRAARAGLTVAEAILGRQVTGLESTWRY